MCGLAGIWGRIGPTNRAAIDRMCDAMVHRGPDAEGRWEARPDAHGWGPLFGHRRLAILDLSPAGAQPMADATHGHALVLNGEIYNYVELRERLPAGGAGLASSGDTAVLLHTLAQGGPSAVESLRGMFAFAYWDATRRELYLARDALGIKPLYFARNPDRGGDWSFAFASELRALLASGLLEAPRLDPAAVASVVWNGFTVAPRTMIAGVESLWPGELRVFHGRGEQASARRYWTVPAPGSAPAATEDEVADALSESVRLHLASDAPLGVFLSGGVDSSVVANLAQQASPIPVHTFTLAFEEAASNEGEHARRVAAAIGTRHQELLLTQSRFLEGLDRALDSLDQPSFDGINTYFMSQAVRDAGFKVALVGSGGDELFGGYTSFRDLPRLQCWGAATRALPAAAQARAAALALAVRHPSASAFPAQTRWAKLPAMLQRRDEMIALYQVAYALFLPETFHELVEPALREQLVDGLGGDVRASLASELDDRRGAAAVALLEQRLFLGERLLRDADATSMAASIEMRLPLVDQQLLATVDRVPPTLRFSPMRSKALLRRCGLRPLDPSLFDRPKAGFELPYDAWLRSQLGTRIDATMHDGGLLSRVGLSADAVARLWQAFRAGHRGLYWSRVWSLFVLARWCDRHGVAL